MIRPDDDERSIAEFSNVGLCLIAGRALADAEGVADEFPVRVITSCNDVKNATARTRIVIPYNNALIAGKRGLYASLQTRGRAGGIDRPCKRHEPDAGRKKPTRLHGLEHGSFCL